MVIYTEATLQSAENKLAIANQKIGAILEELDYLSQDQSTLPMDEWVVRYDRSRNEYFLVKQRIAELPKVIEGLKLEILRYQSLLEQIAAQESKKRVPIRWTTRIRRFFRSV